MTATMFGSLMVVVASIGVVALLICLLPAPRMARTGLCALAVMCGMVWGVDQVRAAFIAEPPQMTKLRIVADGSGPMIQRL